MQRSRHKRSYPLGAQICFFTHTSVAAHRPAETSTTFPAAKSSIADIVLYFARVCVFSRHLPIFANLASANQKPSSAPFGALAPHRPHLGTMKNLIFEPDRPASILPSHPMFPVRSLGATR